MFTLEKFEAASEIVKKVTNPTKLVPIIKSAHCPKKKERED